MEKFMRQWKSRTGLEIIKMRQAIMRKPGDKVQYQQFKDEIEAYVAKAYQKELEAEMKDVYVTDHTPKQKKFATLGKQDDENFFKYKQALQEYNSEVPKPLVTPKKERYERGTLLQRVFDPLAGAEKDENGTLVYTVQDKELINVDNEEKLRAEWERLKAGIENPWDVSEEDQDAIRGALLDELQATSAFSIDEFNEILDKEFSVFKNGEKYDFVADLKDAFSGSLERPAADRILDTIPDYVFWDIKTPQLPDMQRVMNPYNAFRQYHTSSFFDAREYEEYMERRTHKNNLNDGVSTRRRY